MNQTKRTLELIGAILAIIFGVLYLISSLTILTSIDSVLKAALVESGQTLNSSQYEALKNNLQFWTVIDLIISIVILGFSIVLCFPPKFVNGTYRERKGFLITLIVILGINLLLQFNSGFSIYLILIGGSFILLIISLCMKHYFVDSNSTISNFQMGYTSRTTIINPLEKNNDDK